MVSACYHDGMIRAQIQFEADQYERLRQRAAAQGKSISQVVREGVDTVLAADPESEKWARFWAVVGTGRDIEGRTDVAERHDDYLAEIYAKKAHL
jgi:hypothetical protein